MMFSDPSGKKAYLAPEMEQAVFQANNLMLDQSLLVITEIFGDDETGQW